MIFFKHRRRRKARSLPFPPSWLRILEDSVPYYRLLPPDDQHELREHIKVFLSEKTFEGCAGQEITDEVRVTIAAQACVLLLHRDTDYFPGLRTILVYPDQYVGPYKSGGPGGVIREGTQVRAGESWQGTFAPQSGGPVVLSWNHVKRGAADIGDGHNVVFHEFAHQLDGENGAVEGVPVLPDRRTYAQWMRMLGQEYQRLLEDLRTGRPTVLNPYAATNPAEFFAVATEMFFERPRDLQHERPGLYSELRGYYRQDPASIGNEGPFKFIDP